MTDSTFVEAYTEAVRSQLILSRYCSKEVAALLTKDDAAWFNQCLSSLYRSHLGGMKGEAPGIALRDLATRLEARHQESEMR